MRRRNVKNSQWRLDALEGRSSALRVARGGDAGRAWDARHVAGAGVQLRRPLAPLAKVGRVAAGADPPGGGNANGPVGAAPPVPELSSFPSATATLFLDFDGDAGGTWGTYTTTPTPAFDLDGNASAFTAAESASIQEIWERVAEKYSPFRLNVTTVDPGVYNDRSALRVVIGGDGAWTNETPAPGGFAYVGGFANSAPNTVWVFAAKFFGRAANDCRGHGATNRGTGSGWITRASGAGRPRRTSTTAAIRCGRRSWGRVIRPRRDVVERAVVERARPDPGRPFADRWRGQRVRLSPGRPFQARPERDTAGGLGQRF